MLTFSVLNVLIFIACILSQHSSGLQNLVLFDSLDVQELLSSVEMVYSQDSEANDSEEVFQQFFEWKSIKMKKLIHVKRDTDTALQILADWFGGILKVRQSFLLVKKIKCDTVCKLVEE